MANVRFIDFAVTEVPELTDHLAAWADQLPPVGEAVPARPLLVLYDPATENQEFLHSILKAAGYQSPETEAWLLAWPRQQSLDLAALLRHLGTQQLMIFGLDLPPLGLHLQLAPYVPVQLAGNWYLLADGLAEIQAEKAAGKTAKAAALWKAIKSQFMYPQAS